MVKKIEALIEFYKQQQLQKAGGFEGWEEAARVLEADAERFREAGMPDDLRGKTPRREKRTFTPFPNELEVRLVQILSDVQLPDVPTRQISLLKIEGLAEKINQEVGQYVSDDTLLSNLMMREEGSYELFGEEFTHMGEYRIDKRLVSMFNGILTNLYTMKFDRTVGDIRRSSLRDLVYGNNLREDKARFIRKALVPANGNQGRASRQ